MAQQARNRLNAGWISEDFADHLGGMDEQGVMGGLTAQEIEHITRFDPSRSSGNA